MATTLGKIQPSEKVAQAVIALEKKAPENVAKFNVEKTGSQQY